MLRKKSEVYSATLMEDLGFEGVFASSMGNEKVQNYCLNCYACHN